MGATNIIYIATFVQQTATVGVVVNPSGAGTVSGAATYCVGSNVQLTAIANSGWMFTGWSDGGGQTHSITVGATNITYIATFVQQTKIIRLSGNLVFGNVTTGKTAITTLIIANIGNTALKVSGISYPAGFTGSSWSGTIPAGGSQAVTVTFTPVAMTGYDGTVTVNCDSTSGSSIITVAGTGVTLPVVAKPTITPPAGTFTNTVAVTLRCTTPRATIRYTTNGIPPTSTSPIYKTALTLTNAVTLQAAAFKTKMATSAVASESFTILHISLAITPITLPAGTVKISYPAGVKLQATGGVPGYKWSWAAQTGSKVPTGLTLKAGVISGTPTKADTYHFIVKVTDSKKQVAMLPLTLTVNP